MADKIKRLNSDEDDDDCLITQVVQPKSKNVKTDEKESKRQKSNSSTRSEKRETTKDTERKPRQRSKDDFKKDEPSKKRTKLNDAAYKDTEREPRKRSKDDVEKDEPSKKRTKLNDASYKTPSRSTADDSWDIVDELANKFHVPLGVSLNITSMLDDEQTIPFIARYRKEKTGNMDAAVLREFDEQYEVLKTVKEKAAKVITTIRKSGNADPTVCRAINLARTIEDLETISAPFKLSKTSLAQKARQLGLDKPALAILDDLSRADSVRLDSYVDPKKKGLSTLAEVEIGIKHIIAEQVAKNYDVIKSIKEIFSPEVLFIESKKSRNVKTKKSEKDSKSSKEDDVRKFEVYFDFKRSVTSIQPHQVLALNRGENLKVLSVKIDIPQRYVERFKSDAYRHMTRGATIRSRYIDSLLRASIEDSFDRLTEPLVIRRTRKAATKEKFENVLETRRSELTKQAEKASVEVFANNLRNLLLTSPVRGQTILSIDPGFRQGCKVAVVTPNGTPVYTEKLMLHCSNDKSRDRDNLVHIVRKYECQIIAIGNGTACRETEELISNLIKGRSFYAPVPSYCIVNESGASIYSVSDEAASEFPDMDPNLRSAVSLARRLMDPLSEYVKVDPKHLGIGMYQHDISETMLKKSLDSIIQECVSFVGIDVNTASHTLLSKVAGLTASRAAKLVKFRQDHGAIVNREQILSVPSIGAKTYVQCAGFLRISPKTLQSCLNSQPLVPTKENEKSKPKSRKAVTSVNHVINPLDNTSIHPEAYAIAKRLIVKCNCNLEDVGTLDFIAAVTKYFSKNMVEDAAVEFGAGVPTMKLIVDGLQQELDFDPRGEFNKPLFKKEVRDFNNLTIGMKLSGKVMNCTTFGVFVDVGVGRDGLILNKFLNPAVLQGRELSVGDRVDVRVDEINHDRRTFTLALYSVDRSVHAILS